jgi:general secretion pathway protein C
MQTRSISAINVDSLFVRGRRVALGLLVLGIVYALTLFVWRFGGSAETRVIDEPATTPAAEGRAPDIVSASPPTQTLELVGILAMGTKSLAVIASGDREGVFAVGDSITGDTRVKAVLADRVLLEGSHGPQTLLLQKDRIANAAADLLSASPQQQGQSELPESLTDYRDRFLNAPKENAIERFGTSELVDYFIPATTPTGELMGYRLSPNSREPHYQQIGLQPGDVITTVNGIPLSQEDNSVRALRRLRSDGLASITLIRDRNKIIDITIMRDDASKASE